jgi:hypothetical protein
MEAPRGTNALGFEISVVIWHFSEDLGEKTIFILLHVCIL